ncbi:MAG: DnaJ domain-containing protein [Sedimenticola sp.]|nr:DnaJ domain-containing protein [Sedimenticola sp.]
MHNNPLIPPILHLLRTSPEGLSEHQLIKQLQRDAALEDDAMRGDLGLFQTHFLVMNALYQLQDELRGDGLLLQIDPLCVRLLPWAEGDSDADALLARDEPLRRYYLEWEHLQQTRESDVAKLLQRFWDRYYAIERQAEALCLLGLTGEEMPSWERIQRHYRLQAAKHHPDKGGDSDRFIQIREAYELLRQLHGGRG